MTAVFRIALLILSPFRHLRYFIAAFGIVFFWRGVWMLLDAYLFPIHEPTENQIYSAITSFVIGIFLLYIDDFRLDELRAATHPLKVRRRKRILRNSRS